MVGCEAALRSYGRRTPIEILDLHGPATSLNSCWGKVGSLGLGGTPMPSGFVTRALRSIDLIDEVLELRVGRCCLRARLPDLAVLVELTEMIECAQAAIDAVAGPDIIYAQSTAGLASASGRAGNVIIDGPSIHFV